MEKTHKNTPPTAKLINDLLPKIKEMIEQKKSMVDICGTINVSSCSMKKYLSKDLLDLIHQNGNNKMKHKRKLFNEFYKNIYD